jgi:O-methyltransferase
MVMRNSLKRRIAQTALAGREETVLRIALASKYATLYSRSQAAPSFKDRFAMYAHVNSLLNGQAIDYLEFGVFEGESIRAVADLNKHPDSRFIGFDSFEGLPTDWNTEKPKGTFSKMGAVPQSDDQRINFVKGLFSETLPEFAVKFKRSRPIWIHIDCDLFSSTIYVLIHLDNLIRVGDIIAFDELDDLTHEFRAFMDYLGFTQRLFEVVGWTESFGQVAFRCVR